MTALTRQADGSEGQGQDLSLRLSALEWRVDASAGATASCLQAVEGKQARLRAALAGVRGTAEAAAARGEVLGGEVARLKGRVDAQLSPSPHSGARPLFRNY